MSSIVFLKSDFLLHIVSIFILLCLTIISKKLMWVKTALLSLLVLLTGSWYISNRLSGNGIDLSVVYHLANNIQSAGFAGFYIEIALAVSILFAIIMFFFLPLLIKNSWVNYGRSIAILFLIVFFYSFFNARFYKDISVVYNQLNSKDQSGVVANEYLRNLPDLTNKKNIILIYAEGLERTYFNEQIFPNLMPQLNQLKNEAIDFTQVYTFPGGGWTIGGLVSSMCGSPLTISSHLDGNSMGNFYKFLPGAFCLGSYLKNQGYTTEFIGGASEQFAGKGKFLKEHGFDSIKSKSFFLKKFKNSTDFTDWGVHDDKLLDEAFNSFVSYAEKKQPFLLTLLTLDTHHPHGYISGTCNKSLSIANYVNNRFLKAVHCSDMLLANFIKRIQKTMYYSNTLVVLVSDHIALPNDASGLLNSQKESRKNLFLIFAKNQSGEKIDTYGSTLDTSATILNKLDKNISKLGFGRSLLTSKNDGASLAILNGKPFAPYLDYGRRLWGTLSKSDSILLKNNLIIIGKQQLAPPFLIVFDTNGQAKDVFFQNLQKVYDAYQDHEDIMYVKKCHNLSLRWCMLLKKGNFAPILVSQQELNNGFKIQV